MAIIFITHDLGLAHHYAENVCVMRLGEIVEQGSIEQVFAAPRHNYTIKLINAKPEGMKTPVAADAPLLLSAKKCTSNSSPNAASSASRAKPSTR